MKVYVVFRGYDSEVIGVFLSKEKADAESARVEEADRVRGFGVPVGVEAYEVQE